MGEAAEAAAEALGALATLGSLQEQDPAGLLATVEAAEQAIVQAPVPMAQRVPLVLLALTAEAAEGAEAEAVVELAQPLAERELTAEQVVPALTVPLLLCG